MNIDNDLVRNKLLYFIEYMQILLVKDVQFNNLIAKTEPE